MINEMNLAQSLRFPLIVGSIDQFVDPEKHCCLVFEFYKEGNFQEYLNSRKTTPFTEKEILRLIVNMAVSINHVNM
jgi:serine/threonine protein kinase